MRFLEACLGFVAALRNLCERGLREKKLELICLRIPGLLKSKFCEIWFFEAYFFSIIFLQFCF